MRLKKLIGMVRGEAILAAAVAGVMLAAGTAAPARADVERIREKALELEQKINKHRFEVEVRGEKRNILRIYKDFEFILKRSKVEEAQEASAKDPHADRLRLYLIEAAVGLELASYTDDLENYLATATADLDGKQEPYSNLLADLSKAPDDAARRKVYTALKGLVETANVFRNQIVQRTNEAYQTWGYENFAAFYAEREGLDLDASVAAAREFLETTQASYDGLFEEMAMAYLGVEARKVRFADLPYLFQGTAFLEHMPSSGRRERMNALFQGLGVDLVGESNLTYDTKERMGRPLAAGVYPIQVPNDIAAGFLPTGGLQDGDRAATVLAAAQSFTMSRQTAFEPAYLARQAPLAALGALARSIRDEIGWLGKHAKLEGEDLAAYRRYRVFTMLLEARMLAATVIYEVDLYRGGTDAERTFKDVMKEATGIRLSSTDSARSLEFAAELRSVSRFHGMLWAEGIRSHLRETLGDDWYRDGKAAGVLKAWWAEGGALDRQKIESVVGDLSGGAASFLARLQESLES